MGKRIILSMVIVLCACSLFAQAPERFSYQAVVRNDSSKLVCNRPVGVQASILNDAGGLLYRERHVEETNENGLLTLEIGYGNALEGSFSDIPWGTESVFLRMEIDPSGGENYVLSITQRLVSVPYALYAKEAANGFSGDYNDLTNRPTIPTVPTNVSAFTNDAGYITMSSVPTVPTNVSAFSNDAGYITGYTETDPQFNAWDKDYNDLINTPEIPTVPTNVSAFTNDAGYITMGSVPTVPTDVSAFNNDAGYLTSYTETDPQFNAWDKDYNDLINTPEIPTVPTNVSYFVNDAGYLTDYSETDPHFDDWNLDYNTLNNKPVIPTVPTNVSAFANDAGYITMDSVPTVPTNVSAFVNDAGYLTENDEADPQFNAWDKNYNDLTNRPELFSGDYNDLTNKPTLFSGNYNDLTNKPANADFGHALVRGMVNNPAGATDIAVTFTNYSLVTGGLVSIVFARNVPAGSTLNINNQGAKPILWHGAQLADGVIKANDRCLVMYSSGNDRYYLLAIDRWGADIDALAEVARTGSYNDLTNKPTIPTVPTNVSAFVNDVGYLTAIPDSLGVISIESDPVFSAWDRDYNDLTNLPELFSGDYNDLTNKPTLFSGNYNDLINQPDLFSGSYNDLTDKPNLFSGNYNDLTNKPTNADFGQALVRGTVNNPAGATDIAVTFNNYSLVTGGLVSIVFARNVPAGANLNINNQGSKPILWRGTALADGVIKANDRCLFMYQSSANSYFLLAIDRWGVDLDAFATVARTGNYNDLTNKPTIPTVPTNVSAFANDAGYLTAHQDISGKANIADLAPVAFSGSYNDLTNKPTIPNDNNLVHLTGNETITGNKTLSSDLLLKNSETATGVTPFITFQRGTLTDGYVDWKINNDVGNLQFFYSKSGTDTKKFEINNSTALFSTNVEASQFIKTGGTSTQFLKADGSIDNNTYLTEHQDISGKANTADLATVAFSGNYNDLSNKPTIPTALSAFDNDAGYLTAAQCEGVDFCTLANLVAALQQQVSTLQATIDSLMLVPDGYSCPGLPTVTDYDGNTYNTVHIGNQCWMKENLRTTHYSDGTPISAGGVSSSSSTPYYYNYSSFTIPLEMRGYLYNWSAAMHGASSSNSNPSGVQGICPSGWHLPSDAEWSQLTNYVSSVSEYQCDGNDSYIAKSLASTSGWESNNGNCAVGNNQTANNVTGFAAVPAGNFGNSSLQTSGSRAFFWSSTENESYSAWFRTETNDNPEVSRSSYQKTNGFSIRCLRN